MRKSAFVRCASAAEAESVVYNLSGNDYIITSVFTYNGEIFVVAQKAEIERDPEPFVSE